MGRCRRLVSDQRLSRLYKLYLQLKYPAYKIVLPFGRRPDGGIFWVGEFVWSINSIVLLPCVNRFYYSRGK